MSRTSRPTREAGHRGGPLQTLVVTFETRDMRPYLLKNTERIGESSSIVHIRRQHGDDDGGWSTSRCDDDPDMPSPWAAGQEHPSRFI